MSPRRRAPDPTELRLVDGRLYEIRVADGAAVCRAAFDRPTLLFLVEREPRVRFTVDDVLELREDPRGSRRRGGTSWVSIERCRLAPRS
jgi:hypothetical protein